jgi:hypothetical protein
LAIGAQLTAKVEEEGKFKHEVDINNTPARYEFLRPGRRDEVRLHARLRARMHVLLHLRTSVKVGHSDGLSMCAYACACACVCVSGRSWW